MSKIGIAVIGCGDIARARYFPAIAGLYAWDERKRASNLRKHGVDFAIVQNFDFETAFVLRDDRKN